MIDHSTGCPSLPGLVPTLITMILPAEVSSNAEYHLGGEQQHHHLPRPHRHHVQPRQQQEGITTENNSTNGFFWFLCMCWSVRIRLNICILYTFKKSFPYLQIFSLPIRREEGWRLFSTSTANFDSKLISHIFLLCAGIF